MNSSYSSFTVGIKNLGNISTFNEALKGTGLFSDLTFAV